MLPEYAGTLAAELERRAGATWQRSLSPVVTAWQGDEAILFTKKEKILFSLFWRELITFPSSLTSCHPCQK